MEEMKRLRELEKQLNEARLNQTNLKSLTDTDNDKSKERPQT